MRQGQQGESDLTIWSIFEFLQSLWQISGAAGALVAMSARWRWPPFGQSHLSAYRQNIIIAILMMMIMIMVMIIIWYSDSDISCLSISGRVGWRRPLGSLTKMKMAFWTGQNFNRFHKLSLKIFDPIFPGIKYGGCGNTQENIWYPWRGLINREGLHHQALSKSWHCPNWLDPLPSP